MNQDWTGNTNSIYMSLGASNYTEKDREANDYYATDPEDAELLLGIEEFSPNIWECACGEGHLSKVFIDHGFNVTSTDLCERGYGDGGVDFLKCTEQFDGDIITNPPYKYASEFIEKALQLVPDGHKVAMFLKIQFIEGKARGKLFTRCPPKTVWVSRSRILCAKNADFAGMKAAGGSAVAYAWFVWEKNYIGDTILRWCN
jgi:hypothetical protein